MRQRLFTRFAWGVLAYNVLVVLWGAYVRATGSGAGCGSHWPLCNGEVLPRPERIETVIEFTHRVTSGLSLLLVAALIVWVFRLFPRGHAVRRAAVLSGAFLGVEALLGAGLVLLRFVEQNASAGRAVYLSAHLANTQVLLGMLAATAWFAPPRGKAVPRPRAIAAALPVALAVTVTGAIAALGDTLFPAVSFTAGLRQEMDTGSHVLLRLRLLHPAAAIAGGAFLLYVALCAVRARRAAEAGWAAIGLLAIQMVAGAVNVALLAPVWMQLVHLLLADLLWIALVLLYLRSGYMGGEPLPPAAAA